jgi:hypothetical protein
MVGPCGVSGHHRIDSKPECGWSALAVGAGRAKALGRKRAAYWRSLGFPNLLKAREVSARNRGARKQARQFAEAKLRNPFALEKRPRGF